MVPGRSRASPVILPHFSPGDTRPFKLTLTTRNSSFSLKIPNKTTEELSSECVCVCVMTCRLSACKCSSDGAAKMGGSEFSIFSHFCTARSHCDVFIFCWTQAFMRREFAGCSSPNMNCATQQNVKYFRTACVSGLHICTRMNRSRWKEKSSVTRTP